MKESAVLYVVAAVVLSTVLISGAAILGGALMFTGCCGQYLSAGELSVQGIIEPVKSIVGQPAQIQQETPYQRVGPCKLELQACSFDEDCCIGLKCMGSCVNPSVSEQSRIQAQQYQAEVYARVNRAATTMLQGNGTANQTAPVETIQNQTAGQDAQPQTDVQPVQTPPPAQTPPVQQPPAPKIVQVKSFRDNAGRQQLQSCVRDKMESCTQPSPDGMFAVNYAPVATITAGNSFDFTVDAEEATEYNFGFNYVAQVSGKNLVFQEAYSGWTTSKTWTIRLNSGVGDGKYSIGTDTGGMTVQNKKLVAFVRVRNADGKNELGASSVAGMDLGDDVTAMAYTIQ
ncbi:hypothetical protein HY992_04705 [Candidatus Micrarchaeota archaeon]|nr:hypothetical protein [Candidatus Micrarchaeota archaeon]